MSRIEVHVVRGWSRGRASARLGREPRGSSSAPDFSWLERGAERQRGELYARGSPELYCESATSQLQSSQARPAAVWIRFDSESELPDDSSCFVLFIAPSFSSSHHINRPRPSVEAAAPTLRRAPSSSFRTTPRASVEPWPPRIPRDPTTSWPARGMRCPRTLPRPRPPSS